MSAADDYAASGEAGYTGSYVDTGTAFGLPAGDVAEWNKMSLYTAAPWWQNVIGYGLTKAIDNTFPGQNTGVQGNTQPGSFAGQNGKSYNQVGGVNAAPTLAGIGASISRMSPVTLGLIAVAAYFFLKK